MDNSIRDAVDYIKKEMNVSVNEDSLLYKYLTEVLSLAERYLECGENFRETVGQAIGRASVCWSEIPNGTFDSTKGLELIEEIVIAHLKDKERLLERVSVEKILKLIHESGWTWDNDRKTKLAHAIRQLVEGGE